MEGNNDSWGKKGLTFKVSLYIFLNLQTGDSQYEEAVEGEGRQCTPQWVSEQPRALSNCTGLRTLRCIPVCVWPFLTPSENHCSVHPVLLLGVYPAPQGCWARTKRMTTVLIFWNLSLQDEEQKWLFPPKLPARFPTSCIKHIFSFLICLKADL